MTGLPSALMIAFALASGAPAADESPLLGSMTLPDLLASLDGNCWAIDENGVPIEGEALFELRGEVEIECFAEFPSEAPSHANVI